ncbi:MAG: outer-membrane lipoprotein carrier protein LolA [Bauldia sp.]|nr:outer-membrane lipoprotein carrier protein LolA [Bauldia sp.]
MLAATGVDALAGGVPIDPVPNPRPRPGYAPTASAPTAARTETAAVVRKTGGRGDALSNINAYFNGFKTMQGQFIQFGPHGEQSEGDFYIARPGKIRFKYNPPVPLDVIADGRNVAIRNTRTATQDYYPLGKTPLRYLLADNIDLTSGVVNEVRQEPDLIALIIVEDSRLVKGKLTLIFDKQTYELKQWIVTDAQGLNTSVAVYNTTTGGRLDPGLFKINYYQ